MFQYKLKLSLNGEFVTRKCKARLCARGDLHLLIALATQYGLILFQFNVQGAFLCADIDTDIYLKLPPGYQPPPGKTAKLRKSLYCRKQAPMAWQALIEKWML
eukprot:3689162-Rhodomonas_salina.1